jgi:hypothetical protein
VRLTYRDDEVTGGVRAGVAAWVALVLAAGATTVAAGVRRRHQVSPATTPGAGAPPR